jgi:hypothetical protein
MDKIMSEPATKPPTAKSVAGPSLYGGLVKTPFAGLNNSTLATLKSQLKPTQNSFRQNYVSEGTNIVSLGGHVTHHPAVVFDTTSPSISKFKDQHPGIHYETNPQVWSRLPSAIQRVGANAEQKQSFMDHIPGISDSNYSNWLGNLRKEISGSDSGIGKKRGYTDPDASDDEDEPPLKISRPNVGELIPNTTQPSAPPEAVDDDDDDNDADHNEGESDTKTPKTTNDDISFNDHYNLMNDLYAFGANVKNVIKGDGISTAGLSSAVGITRFINNKFGGSLWGGDSGMRQAADHQLEGASIALGGMNKVEVGNPLGLIDVVKGIALVSAGGQDMQNKMWNSSNSNIKKFAGAANPFSGSGSAGDQIVEKITGKEASYKNAPVGGFYNDMKNRTDQMDSVFGKVTNVIDKVSGFFNKWL